MKSVSVVIPALNEEQGIGFVLREIPVDELCSAGYDVEIVVVDNGSTDGTAAVARSHGATVISQPERGYGNAYRKGFAYARGDVIATGDADLTYPFGAVPDLLGRLVEGWDFVNTDRLSRVDRSVMSPTHMAGNLILSLMARMLFGAPFKDSQSGMWLFKREILEHLRTPSPGMAFSQEIKLEAYLRGFRCTEMPIEYRARAGECKLNTLLDGARNARHLVRMWRDHSPQRTARAALSTGSSA